MFPLRNEFPAIIRYEGLSGWRIRSLSTFLRCLTGCTPKLDDRRWP
jgi:hypothetical protein